MANEISNLLSAQGLLGLNAGSNSEIIRGFGIRSVARVVDGEFIVKLEQPVSFFQGQVLATSLANARMVSATLVEGSSGPYETGDISIKTFDAAGVAVNGVGVSLAVLRFPTVG